jgi:hypothetical protein
VPENEVGDIIEYKYKPHREWRHYFQLNRIQKPCHVKAHNEEGRENKTTNRSNEKQIVYNQIHSMICIYTGLYENST